jgi:heat shock protein HtpX
MSVLFDQAGLPAPGSVVAIESPEARFPIPALAKPNPPAKSIDPKIYHKLLTRRNAAMLLGSSLSIGVMALAALKASLTSVILQSLMIGAMVFMNGNKNVLQGTQPLDPRKHAELFQMVADLSLKADIPAPELRLWDIPSPNAAATQVKSLFGKPRTIVLFSPDILKMLTPRELAGVAGHEISHLRHGDTTLMRWSTLSFFLILLFMGVNIPWLSVRAALLVGHQLLGLYAMRCQESLADLGSAAMTSPEAQAGAMLKLDLWTRLVGGAVNDPLLEPRRKEVFHTHPSAYRRVAMLRGLAEEEWPSELPRFPGTAPGTGNLLGWLAHCDDFVRRKAAQGMRKMAVWMWESSAIDAAIEAVDSALRLEEDPALSAALLGVRPRLLARKRFAARDAFKPGRQVRASVLESLRRAEEAGRLAPDPLAVAGAAALLSGTAEPEMFQGMDNPGTLETLQGMTLKLVDQDADGRKSLWDPSDFDERLKKLPSFLRPMPSFLFLDDRDGTLFVSRALWESLDPAARAGLLYRRAAELRARRHFRRSGEKWAGESPENLFLKISLLSPLPGSSVKTVLKAQRKLARTIWASAPEAFLRSVKKGYRP